MKPFDIRIAGSFYLMSTETAFTLEDAIRYGEEHFPNDGWEICNGETGYMNAIMEADYN